MYWLTFDDLQTKKDFGYKYVRFTVNFEKFGGGAVDDWAADGVECNVLDSMWGYTNATDNAKLISFGHKYNGNVYFLFDNYYYRNPGGGKKQDGSYGLARRPGSDFQSEWYWNPYSANGELIYGKRYYEIRNSSNDPDWTPNKQYELNTDYIFEYHIESLENLELIGFEYATISNITWSATGLK